MTTANMEASGKYGMFCKLLLSVMCVFALLHSVEASRVVSFNQQERQVNTEEHLRSARHARQKRSSETDSERNDNKCDSQKEKFEDAIKGGKHLETRFVFESETKFSLAMAWAGIDDDGVLVVLTTSADESTLWRSKEFGRKWSNISSQVKNSIFRKADGLQRNPHDPKWIYLISYDLFLYYSEDGGENWHRKELGDIVRADLVFHPDAKYKDHILIVTLHDKLLMTKNNFKDVKTIREKQTLTAHWGTEGSGRATDMYMTFGDRSQSYQSYFPFSVADPTVTTYDLQRRSSEDDDGEWKTIHTNVVDFGIQGDFLYASAYVHSSPNKNSERQLIVSSDGGDHWNEAQLPTITSDRFFSVLDMSEHMIFMHVDNPGDTGHGTLYTSWSHGIFFSESLQRHLYPNFNSLTDFYKVSSMRGTYIASQLDNDNSIHSVITFDLGGQWQPLAKPDDAKCADDSVECSLQIHNAYSVHRGINAFPPVSTEDAVGLILVNAHPAKSLQTTDPDVYISSDGGYSWRKALDGPHSYVIADSGGLIAAVSLRDPNTKEVKFSTDEGRCWHVYQFTNETLHHTGLLTEPGGKSMTISLWGYREADKKWTVNVIDFADVITDHCTASDYEDWMPHESMKKEDASRQGCLLGSKTVYQRLKHDSWCHNGYQYKPQGSDKTCVCSFDDFECDYGYYRPGEQDKCVKEPNFSGPEIDVCFRGHEQKVISEGYRKIPGDVCNEQGGFRPTSRYINLTQTCSERIKMTTLSPEELEKQKEESQKGGNGLIIALVIFALVVAAAGLSYFGYKMVLLRRHKVVYRYSMLNQGDDKDYDEEIERTLTGSQPHPMFGEVSDEEEMVPTEPRRNGHVQRGRPKMKGFHDDSDDDMLD